MERIFSKIHKISNDQKFVQQQNSFSYILSNFHKQIKINFRLPQFFYSNFTHKFTTSNSIVNPFAPMIFVLRHGERADQTTPEEQKTVELSIDPHLTEKGKIQSQECGKAIKQFVELGYKNGQIKTKTPKFLIVSSPFLRCIMTSENIIKSLGPENIHSGKIFLDDVISEHLATKYFDKCPLKNLYVRNKDISKYCNYPLQDGLQKEGTHLGEPKFPESYPNKERDEMFLRVCKYYGDNFTKDGDVVLVLVGHGMLVQTMLEFYDAKKNWDLRYTCLNLIAYDENHPKLGKVVVGQYHDHLDNVEKVGK